MSGLKIITGPTAAPISRIEAKGYLRLDDDLDDPQVRSFIQAATDWAENYTGRFFISRTCSMMLNGAHQTEDLLSEGLRTGYSGVYYVNNIELAASPVISVESIKYYSDDNTESTWDASNYYVDLYSDPAKIVLRDGGAYPTDLRSANGLEINFTAGYGQSSFSVPEAIRMAIMQYLTFLYEHRGDYEAGLQPPAITKALLEPYRILRFNSNPYDKILKAGVF